MILHVHKERVDQPDLGKIAENYVSGRKDTLRKLGWILWTVWEFCRLVTLLTRSGRNFFIFVSWLNGEVCIAGNGLLCKI